MENTTTPNQTTPPKKAKKKKKTEPKHITARKKTDEGYPAELGQMLGF